MIGASMRMMLSAWASQEWLNRKRERAKLVRLLIVLMSNLFNIRIMVISCWRVNPSAGRLRT
ncbi:hypothetical protein D3C80_2130860 [compost metagenome]